MTVNGSETAYYQVSTTTLDEAFGTADYEGIKKIIVLEWLLGS